MVNSANRRVFINKGNIYYQIYSFAQHDDGSIYCSSKDFSNAKWVGIDINKSNINIKLAENIGDGKISIHGSGMVAVRPHINPKGHQIIISGNQLLSLDKKEIGARHLFTTFIKEPTYIPKNSPALNRVSDSIIQANEGLAPLVLIFFAVPQNNLTLDFQISINEDLLNNIPGDFLGFGNISLKYHDVVWFAYRTRNMGKWPKYSHYIYADGYAFPLFIGTGPGTFGIDIRQPVYSIDQNIFTIKV